LELNTEEDFYFLNLDFTPLVRVNRLNHCHYWPTQTPGSSHHSQAVHLRENLIRSVRSLIDSFGKDNRHFGFWSTQWSVIQKRAVNGC